eukprot:COSAG01_NODE_17170_length_1173_cov_1.195531_2_plen_59_part_01
MGESSLVSHVSYVVLSICNCTFARALATVALPTVGHRVPQWMLSSGDSVQWLMAMCPTS